MNYTLLEKAPARFWGNSEWITIHVHPNPACLPSVTLWAQAQVFPVPSHYGIGGEGLDDSALPASARISRLSVRAAGVEYYNYDRGLDFCKIDPDTLAAVLDAVLDAAKG